MPEKQDSLPRLSSFWEDDLKLINQELSNIVSLYLNSEAKLHEIKDLVTFDRDKLLTTFYSIWNISEKLYKGYYKANGGCQYTLEKNVKTSNFDEQSYINWSFEFTQKNTNFTQCYIYEIVARNYMRVFLANLVQFTLLPAGVDKKMLITHLMSLGTKGTKVESEFISYTIKCLFVTLVDNIYRTKPEITEDEDNSFKFIMTIIGVFCVKLTTLNENMGHFILRNILRLPGGLLIDDAFRSLKLCLSVEHPSYENDKESYVVNFFRCLKLLSSYKTIWPRDLIVCLNKFSNNKFRPCIVPPTSVLGLKNLLTYQEMVGIIKQFDFSEFFDHLTSKKADIENFKNENEATNYITDIINKVAICISELYRTSCQFVISSYLELFQTNLSISSNLLIKLGNFIQEMTEKHSFQLNLSKIKNLYNQVALSFIIESTRNISTLSLNYINLKFVSFLDSRFISELHDHYIQLLKQMDKYESDLDFYDIYSQIILESIMYTPKNNDRAINSSFIGFCEKIASKFTQKHLNKFKSQVETCVLSHQKLLSDFFQHVINGQDSIPDTLLEFADFCFDNSWFLDLETLDLLFYTNEKSDIKSNTFKLTQIIIWNLFKDTERKNTVNSDYRYHQAASVHFCGIYRKMWLISQKYTEDKETMLSIREWIWKLTINLKLCPEFWIENKTSIEVSPDFAPKSKYVQTLIRLKTKAFPYLHDETLCREYDAPSNDDLTIYTFTGLFLKPQNHFDQTPALEKQDIRTFMDRFLNEADVLRTKFPQAYVKCIGRLFLMRVRNNTIVENNLDSSENEYIFKTIKKHSLLLIQQIMLDHKMVKNEEVKSTMLFTFIHLLIGNLAKCKNEMLAALEVFSQTVMDDLSQSTLFLNVLKNYFLLKETPKVNSHKLVKKFLTSVYSNSFSRDYPHLQYHFKLLEVDFLYDEITSAEIIEFEDLDAELKQACIWDKYLKSLQTTSPVFIQAWFQYIRLYLKIPLKIRHAIDAQWKSPKYQLQSSENIKILDKFLIEIKDDESRCSILNYFKKIFVQTANHKKKSKEFGKMSRKYNSLYLSNKKLPSDQTKIYNTNRFDKGSQEKMSSFKYNESHFSELTTYTNSNSCSINIEEKLREIYFNFAGESKNDEATYFFEDLLDDFFESLLGANDTANKYRNSIKYEELLLLYQGKNIFKSMKFEDNYDIITNDQKQVVINHKKGPNYGITDVSLSKCSSKKCKCQVNISVNYWSIQNNGNTDKEFEKSCIAIKDCYDKVYFNMGFQKFTQNISYIYLSLVMINQIRMFCKFKAKQSLLIQNLSPFILFMFQRLGKNPDHYSPYFHKIYVNILISLGTYRTIHDETGEFTYEILKNQVEKNLAYFEILLAFFKPPTTPYALETYCLIQHALMMNEDKPKEDTKNLYYLMVQALNSHDILKWNTFYTPKNSSNISDILSNNLKLIESVIQELIVTDQEVIPLIMKDILKLIALCKNDLKVLQLLIKQIILYVISGSLRVQISSLLVHSTLKMISKDNYESICNSEEFKFPNDYSEMFTTFNKDFNLPDDFIQSMIEYTIEFYCITPRQDVLGSKWIEENYKYAQLIMLYFSFYGEPKYPEAYDEKCLSRYANMIKFYNDFLTCGFQDCVLVQRTKKDKFIQNVLTNYIANFSSAVKVSDGRWKSELVRQVFVNIDVIIPAETPTYFMNYFKIFNDKLIEFPWEHFKPNVSDVEIIKRLSSHKTLSNLIIKILCLIDINIMFDKNMTDSESELVMSSLMVVWANFIANKSMETNNLDQFSQKMNKLSRYFISFADFNQIYEQYSNKKLFSEKSFEKDERENMFMDKLLRSIYGSSSDTKSNISIKFKHYYYFLCWIINNLLLQENIAITYVEKIVDLYFEFVLQCYERISCSATDINDESSAVSREQVLRLVCYTDFNEPTYTFTSIFYSNMVTKLLQQREKNLVLPFWKSAMGNSDLDEIFSGDWKLSYCVGLINAYIQLNTDSVVSESCKDLVNCCEESLTFTDIDANVKSLLSSNVEFLTLITQDLLKNIQKSSKPDLELIKNLQESLFSSIIGKDQTKLIFFVIIIKNLLLLECVVLETQESADFSLFIRFVNNLKDFKKNKLSKFEKTNKGIMLMIECIMMIICQLLHLIVKKLNSDPSSIHKKLSAVYNIKKISNKFSNTHKEFIDKLQQKPIIINDFSLEPVKSLTEEIIILNEKHLKNCQTK